MTEKLPIAMLVFALTTCMTSEPASADGAFLDLGLGYALDSDATVGKSCLRDWKKDSQEWGCSENPLGYAALGYQAGRVTFAIEHWSALSEYDAGLDIVSVKVRFGGNK